MKVMTSTLIIMGLWINTTFAVDIQILTTPGAERDQIEKQYEVQMKSGSADATVLGELGVIYHMKAVEHDSDPETVKEAHRVLKKAFLMDKSNAQTRAYYGSITSLMATTVKDGMKQMKFVKSGTRNMDKAVKASPNDISIRMLRGNNSLNLPKFLQRARYAITDFSHILTLIEGAPHSFKAQIHYRLGQAYERTEQIDKAKAEWKQVIQLAPHSSWASKAAEKL